MRRLGVFWVALLLLTAACGKLARQSERIVVAECYDKKLYADELEGLVPSSAGKLDSMAQTSAYIDTWVHRQLLVHQAEMNLSPRQLDFTKQLQDYRNSLVIYAYETQLVDRYLDTVVTQEEITTYYEEHEELLNKPIEDEEEGIRNIILLKRQKELLEHMHSDLYEQAKKEKVFEIY